KEHIATHDFFKDNEIAHKKPRSAILALQRLATAREGTIRSKQNAQSSSSGQPKPKPGAPNSNNQSNNNQSNNNQSNSRPLPVRNFAEAYDEIPNELHEARKIAGLCVRCNSNKHKARTCNQPRNLTPVPAAVIRARLNALQAVMDDALVDAPANSTEPKN
ncbi:MAG TPA: hypothetical protein V6C65_32955, partial [Allocoleopsis sp.]